MFQAAKEDAKGITKRIAELECGATPSTKRVSNSFYLNLTEFKAKVGGQPRGSVTFSNN